jgi:hypothetical protein
LACQHWRHQLVGRSLCLVCFGGCKSEQVDRSIWSCSRLSNSCSSVLWCHHSIIKRWAIINYGQEQHIRFCLWPNRKRLSCWLFQLTWWGPLII